MTGAAGCGRAVRRCGMGLKTNMPQQTEATNPNGTTLQLYMTVGEGCGRAVTRGDMGGVPWFDSVDSVFSSGEGVV